MYSPESSVRKTGSYIYEEFMPTDGTDVKVEYCLSIDLLRRKDCVHSGNIRPEEGLTMTPKMRMTEIQRSSGVHCRPGLCSC